MRSVAASYPGDDDERRPSFVSVDAARAVLPWRDAVEALRGAYAIKHAEAAIPPRAVARGEAGWLRTLSAAPPGCRFMGAKVFGIGPKRAVNYAIILVEQDSGLIAAIVDGAAITAIRTAATSAVAIDRLAAAGPLRIGVLGSGDEAMGHVEAIAAVRPVAKLAVFSPTGAKRDAFAAHFQRQRGIPSIAVATPDAVAEDVDVLIAAARSKDESPIVHGRMLHPGMLTVSIGSTLPEQREADVTAIAACDLIVCDAVEEVMTETGDMLAASAAGIDVDAKIISLNALMSGASDGRVRDARQIMFKSVGSALQDIVIAGLAFERAEEAGLSERLPFQFYTKFV